MGTRKESSAPAFNDATQWQSLLEGNRSAFACIYQRHVRLLYNYGKQLSPDSEMIKDCIQDLFVNLWQKRDRLGKTDSIKYYLFKSLRRSIIKASTQQRKHATEAARIVGETVVFPYETTLVADEMRKQYRVQLTQSLKLLPARQREVLFLLYYEGLNYAQVAEIMGINTRSVYTLTWKAIGSLRKEMLPLATTLLSLVLVGSLIVGFLIF